MECHLVNNTPPDSPSVLPSSQDLDFLELWLSCVLVISVVLLGACSNVLGFVLTVVCGARSRFHTVFIANLALADLLSTLVAPIGWLLFSGVVHPSPLTLVILGAVKQALQAASAAAVVSITLDRLCLACRPIRYHLREGTTRALGLVLLIWLLCTGLHVPLILVCPHIRRYLSVIFVVAEFLVPMVILCACNCTIYRQIFRNRQLRTLRRHSGMLPTTKCSDSMDNVGNRFGRKQSLPCLTTYHAQPLTTQMSVPGTKPTSSLLREAALNSSSAAGSLRSRRMSLSSLISRQRDSEDLIKDLLQKQHRRALRTLVFIVLLFFFCRLPYTVYHLLCTIFSSTSHSFCQQPRANFYIGFLQHLNSALDPLVYALWGNKLYQEKLILAINKLVARIERMRPCMNSNSTSELANHVQLESSPLVAL